MDLLISNNLFYTQLKLALSRAKDDEQLFRVIVDTPFINKRKTVSLGLGVVVLLLNNKTDGMLDRIALSNTDSAVGAVRMSAKPFKEIRIPNDYGENILVASMIKQKSFITGDWKDMFVPALTPEQARFNQAGAGIGCSAVYPLASRCGGAIIFSYYLPLEAITEKHHAFMKKYSQLVDQALKSK